MVGRRYYFRLCTTTVGWYSELLCFFVYIKKKNTKKNIHIIIQIPTFMYNYAILCYGYGIFVPIHCEHHVPFHTHKKNPTTTKTCLKI